MLKEFADKGLVSPPEWLVDNVQYLVVSGSATRGVTVEDSDTDVYGVACPPLEMVFPHKAGYVGGFGHRHQYFENWNETHVENHDFNVYGHVRFLHLLMASHPDLLSLLWVPDEFVLKSTAVGDHLRANRDVFVSKAFAYKMRDMAKNQLGRMRHARETKDPRKLAFFEQFGYNPKTGYHAVRLLNEARQFMEWGGVQLDADRDRLLAIRNGNYLADKVERIFGRELVQLEDWLERSTLPEAVDEQKAKAVLLEGLELHYGDLRNIF